jgi:hypothetical protein
MAIGPELEEALAALAHAREELAAAIVERRMGDVNVILPFVCPICGWKNYHPRDVAERYCSRCHRFVDEKLPPLPEPSAPGPGDRG